MVSNSSADLTCCVVWRCKLRRGVNVSSKSFLLGNSDCRFEMLVQENSEFQDIAVLKIQFSTGCCAMPFRVTTLVKNLTNRPFYFQAVDKRVDNSEEVIWTRVQNINAFSRNMEIVCLFQPSSLDTKSITQEEIISFLPESRFISIEGLSADFKKLFEDKTSADVTLRCGDRTTSAHRIVLATRSKVFADMLRNKMAESETGAVDISDLEPEMLESFLQYVYSGKIQDLSEDTVSAMYSTGDKYAVRTLQQECSMWILRHLTRENCLRFLLLADAHDDKAFVDEIVLFIADNVEVLKSEEWSTLMENNLRLAAYVYQKCFDKRVFNDD